MVVNLNDYYLIKKGTVINGYKTVFNVYIFKDTSNPHIIQEGNLRGCGFKHAVIGVSKSKKRYNIPVYVYPKEDTQSQINSDGVMSYSFMYHRLYIIASGIDLEDKVVIFKDENSMNISPENMIIVDKSDKCKYIRFHNKSRALPFRGVYKCYTTIDGKDVYRVNLHNEKKLIVNKMFVDDLEGAIFYAGLVLHRDLKISLCMIERQLKDISMLYRFREYISKELGSA